MLQCVTVCRSVFHCVAVWCDTSMIHHVLQRVAECCGVFQRVATCCSVLQRIVVFSSMLQCAASLRESTAAGPY